MPNPTINNIWSSLSTNRSTFNEDEVGEGILYKGPVISNQLNGVLFDVYTMLDDIQRSGGLWSSLKTYYKGDMVTILHKPEQGALRAEKYVCVAKTYSLNKPPLINATYNANVKVPVFMGGTPDRTQWERCDSDQAGAIYQERSSFNNKDIKLFNSPKTITNNENVMVPISGRYNITVYSSRGITSFTCELKGCYLKDTDGTLKLATNRLGFKAPEIYFSNLFTTVTDYGNVENFHNMMPLGIRFQYSSLSQYEGCVFVRLDSSVTKVVIEGVGSYVNANILRDVDRVEDCVVMPPRNAGGFGIFEQVGKLVDYDFQLTPSQQYHKGLFKCQHSAAYSGAEKKNSPLWVNGQDSGLFSYLARVRGNWQVPIWAGAFRRNLEENKITPNTSNSVRVIASQQGDAIRNITGGYESGEIQINSGDRYGVQHPFANNGYAYNAITFGDGTQNGNQNSISVKNKNTRIIFKFDASLVVPTSSENRPINVAVQYYYQAF